MVCGEESFLCLIYVSTPPSPGENSMIHALPALRGVLAALRSFITKYVALYPGLWHRGC